MNGVAPPAMTATSALTVAPSVAATVPAPASLPAVNTNVTDVAFAATGSGDGAADPSAAGFTASVISAPATGAGMSSVTVNVCCAPTPSDVDGGSIDTTVAAASSASDCTLAVTAAPPPICAEIVAVSALPFDVTGIAA